MHEDCANRHAADEKQKILPAGRDPVPGQLHLGRRKRPDRFTIFGHVALHSIIGLSKLSVYRKDASRSGGARPAVQRNGLGEDPLMRSYSSSGFSETGCWW